MKKHVLFLCAHTSARSQLAEGILRRLGGEQFAAFSAGTEATAVRPLAIRAMQELGIDISGQQSKTLDRYLNDPFDEVITVSTRQPRSVPFSPARNAGGTGRFPTPLGLRGPRRSNWWSTVLFVMRSGGVLRRSCSVKGEEWGE